MKLNEIQGAPLKAANAAGRYGLMRVGQGILHQKGKDWKEQHRTVWCSRSVNRVSETIDLYRSEARDASSMSGLNRCGCIWTCPVCAARISETRREELQFGMVKHVGRGGGAYLFNFTFPHEADEPLGELMEKFGKARQDFQKSREWGAFKRAAGNIELKRGDKVKVDVGVVNSLEVTVSLENGWHPHLHMLVFCKRGGLGVDEKRDEEGNLTSETVERLKARWVECCRKNGLGTEEKRNDMLKHGLVVRGGEKAAEYIAKFGRDEKWGASSELTRTHSKIGAAGERWGVQHFTPFQLLAWAVQRNEKGEVERDGWSIARFREYAEHFEGKRALVWSPGLKSALGVAEIDDDELAAREDKPGRVHVGTINADQLSMLLRKDALPRFLVALTEMESQEHVDAELADIGRLRDTCNGAVKVKKFIGKGFSVIHERRQ